MKPPMPNFDAWKLAEQDLRFAEAQLATAMRCADWGSADLRRVRTSVAEKRKTAFLLYWIAMDEVDRLTSKAVDGDGKLRIVKSGPVEEADRRAARPPLRRL